jgi:hypothetical protein
MAATRQAPHGLCGVPLRELGKERNRRLLAFLHLQEDHSGAGHPRAAHDIERRRLCCHGLAAAPGSKHQEVLGLEAVE